MRTTTTPSRIADDATVHWSARALCQGSGDDLFPEGSAQKSVIGVCHGCPVRLDCLVEALDNRIEWGVWGGLTERERRALLRRRADVTSWRTALVGR